MRKVNDHQVNNQQERQENQSQSAKIKLRTSINSKRKLNFNHKFHQYPRNSSFSSSSLATSYMKANSLSQSDLPIHKHFDFSSLNMAHFTQKYLPRGAPPDQIHEQMKMVLERKDNQTEALRIYRDELKFICFNNPYYTPIRLSLRSLRGKAIVERQISNQRQKIQKQLRQFELQNQAIVEYSHMISQKIKQSQGQILDMEKEQLLMIENLQMQTAHLIKQLAEQKRKNAKQIRQIQDQILDLRVIIKQKQDKLRDLKARICTMYIKLHSRNSSRTGSKSKQRNMSLSVRKFNSQNHQTIRQAFIGNNSFKNYSRQVIEKVNSQDQLTRIKFIFQNRQNLIFQCIYKNSQGLLHTNTSGFRNPDNQITRDKISQQNQNVQQIYTKHLFSMKFFYKAKIVGVQCRVKTQKGTKTIQLGNCDPHVQHELLTLVNKRMVTLGSYWHGKQMIGISVWYSDRLVGQSANMTKIKSSKKIQLKKPKQTYEEYYT